SGLAPAWGRLGSAAYSSSRPASIAVARLGCTAWLYLRRSPPMTDEELADELIERLRDFSPAVSVGPGEDDDQVEVGITMSRRPYTREEMAELAAADPETAHAAAGRMSRAYRALIRRTGVPSGGSELHLVRDDAEASLCGIPRAQLADGGMFDTEVCADCI